MVAKYAFTEIPYTLKEVSLGSLVSNIEQPNQDAFRPKLRKNKDFSIRNQKNFKFVLEATEDSWVRLQFTRLFSFSAQKAEEDASQLFSKEGRVHELTEPKELFRSLRTSESAQQWLLKSLDDGDDEIHMIVSIRTFSNAKTANDTASQSGKSGQAHIPVSQLASQGTSTDDTLDVDLAGGTETSLKESEAYELPGERVFAIRFRKVKLKWLKKTEFEKAKLERDTFWLVTGARRGDDKDEGKRYIEAELEDEDGQEVLVDERDEVIGSVEQFASSGLTSED